MHTFIEALPKVELHLHIEGTLEPELMFALARRNGVDIPFASPDAVRAAYEFTDLQSFLDIYYQGAQVLLHEQDFFDLTWAYLERCRRDRVLHTEIFFDPQTHTARGIAFATVIDGIERALRRAETEFGISGRLIPCFLRHLDEADAEATLDQVLEHRARVTAVGLDSGERGNPPGKFARVFARARGAGLRAVAHAGEEGPPDYIRGALDLLEVARIDHGVRCSEDPELVERLAAERVPLTVCPLSNVKLRVFERIGDHNIVELLRRGLCVTINSDDPAYFGGYMNDNFTAVAEAFALEPPEIAQFSFNAIEASFLDPLAKRRLAAQVESALREHGENAGD